MKPNHMWRMAFVDYEGSTAQCLTCKEFFPADYNKIYKYCPCCGTELKKEFTKRNPRWYNLRFPQHFPTVEIWRLVDKYPDTGYGFFSSIKNMFEVETKPTPEWQEYNRSYMHFNGFSFRKNLLQQINSVSKTVDSPSKIKIVIKTWDGHEKTIYGSCLKSVFDRPYQKIEPPKPYTIACSGVISYPLNYKLVNQSIFKDIHNGGRDGWFR